MYRDVDPAIRELREQIVKLEAERDRLKHRIHFYKLSSPDADTLPIWIAPYVNWLGRDKGACCPACGASSFVFPRVKVHSCEFVNGDHLHVECSNCHEVSCWREKAT